MESENKSFHSGLNKNFTVKNQKELRIKLTKLANSHFNPRCEHFINNMRSLNFRILESSGGQKSIDKEVRESRNFRFGKSKDYFIHFTDLSPYQIEFNPFIKDLKKQFTKDEINIIKKNKDYYVQNEIIKDNLSIFNDQSLYQVLNMEEKEEEEKKQNNKKIFHNLNYFNKRRKSVFIGFNNSNMSNNSNNSGNNSLNKSNKSDKNKNNGLPFYQTSLNNIKEKTGKSIELKNKITYNLENLSHYYVMKNNLDVIEKEIRKGVKKMKKEDEKLNLKKEERKRIFSEFERKSQKEISKFLEQTSMYNNYSNEIDWFKRRQKLSENKNENETFFPLINDNQISSSKIKKPNTLNTYFMSVPHKIPNLKGSSSINMKENQIRLYKNRAKSKKNEFNKKKDEKEQLFIKDIHRKIKSIYESFKYNNKL